MSSVLWVWTESEHAGFFFFLNLFFKLYLANNILRAETPLVGKQIT